MASIIANGLIYSHEDALNYYFDTVAKNTKAWRKLQENLIIIVGSEKAKEYNIVEEVLNKGNNKGKWIMKKDEKSGFIIISKDDYKDYKYKGFKPKKPIPGMMIKFIKVEDYHFNDTKEMERVEKILNIGNCIGVEELFNEVTG